MSLGPSCSTVAYALCTVRLGLPLLEDSACGLVVLVLFPAIAGDPSSPTVGASVEKMRTALPSNTVLNEPYHTLCERLNEHEQ